MAKKQDVVKDQWEEDLLLPPHHCLEHRPDGPFADLEFTTKNGFLILHQYGAVAIRSRVQILFDYVVSLVCVARPCTWIPASRLIKPGPRGPDAEVGDRA